MVQPRASPAYQDRDGLATLMAAPEKNNLKRNETFKNGEKQTQNQYHIT